MGGKLDREVSRLFWDRFDSLFADPDVLSRVLAGSSDHGELFRRRGEEWVSYLGGLREHGVRREGRLVRMVVGSGEDDIVVDDPLSDSSVIIVPREFGFRMVVLGGLP